MSGAIGRSSRPAPPTVRSGRHRLPLLATLLLAGCLDAPARELPDVVCESVDATDADTAIVRVRTDPLRAGAGRLLVRVDSVAAGPGPTGRDPDRGSGLGAGLALDPGGIFRGCAGASSELLLMVPERAMRKGWLRVGSDRPVRVIVESGAGDGTPGGATLLEPGESGVIRWEAGGSGGAAAPADGG